MAGKFHFPGPSMAEQRSTNAQQPGSNIGGAAGGGTYEINLEPFSKRLKSLYSHWENHKSNLWAGADVLSVGTPPASDGIRYLKSLALNIWLFGYEFPETIMVLAEKQIHFLCTQEKASLLEVVRKSAKEAVDAEVTTHVKAKGDDGSRQMDAILRSLSGDNTAIGFLSKEAPEGNLLEAWDSKLKGSDLLLVDITNGLADLFAAKDKDEILYIKKAASLSAAVISKFAVAKLEKIIDDEMKVSHSALMHDTEKAVLDPSRLKVKLNADLVDICYPPIFQSGGQFDLRLSAGSNDENLYYESASVIICAVGARYNKYCSNVARTFLIDATSEQSQAYEVLLKAHQAATAALKPGNKASAAFLAAVAVMERDAPELVGNLTKSAGTGIGLEFSESWSSLNVENELVLRPGMSFNVLLGLQNLQAQTSDPKNCNYSLVLADTVIITEKGRGNEIATRECSKSIEDLFYCFSDVYEEEEELEQRKWWFH